MRFQHTLIQSLCQLLAVSWTLWTYCEGLLKGTVSAQKALKGSETKKLLGGLEEISILSTIHCPSGKSFTYQAPYYIGFNAPSLS